MDLRRISTRQVLLLKPLQNDNKFLTALLNWQNVFSLSSDLTANLGRRYGQRGAVYLKSSLRDTLQVKWRRASWKGGAGIRPGEGHPQAVAPGSPLPSVQPPTSKIQPPPNCFQEQDQGILCPM